MKVKQIKYHCPNCFGTVSQEQLYIVTNETPQCPYCGLLVDQMIKLQQCNLCGKWITTQTVCDCNDDE